MITPTTTASPPAPPTPHRMTFEEYLAFTPESGLAEWIDGEVIVQMTATLEHQQLVQFLSSLLGLFAQIFKLGRVHTAPYAMRAKPEGPGREPDVMFVAAENLRRLGSKYLDGPADLAIEIVSDDSVARDRADKFYEYEEAGVREYWIIDPRPGKQRADFYVRDDKGRYRPVPIDDRGVYASTVLPNFWLQVDWLWATEPNPLTALAEIVGADKLIEALQGKN